MNFERMMQRDDGAGNPEDIDDVEKDNGREVRETEVNIESPEKGPETELSPRKRAEGVLLETMELDGDSGLYDFQGRLAERIKSLPLYQELEISLAETEGKDFVYALFEAVKQSADRTSVDSGADERPIDGVLIRSMRQGKIFCAGRTMIASTLLRERGIEHFVTSGVGHAFIIVEIDEDTLAYFDASEKVYFTFPKSALDGYRGPRESAICSIREYVPRDKDVIGEREEGLGAVHTSFVIMPSAEGVARQYLNNVGAALGGNKEFIKSNIVPDTEAEATIHEIREEILGKNTAWDEFFGPGFVERSKGYEASFQKLREKTLKIIETMKAHPDKDKFAEAFQSFIEDEEVGELFVYLKNAPEETKKKFAEKFWKQLQEPGVIERLIAQMGESEGRA
jgi:hypothetical protein